MGVELTFALCRKDAETPGRNQMPRDEWNPLQELMQLRKRFDEIFERSFMGNLSDDQVQQNFWKPAVDVYRDDERIVVTAEIPGVSRKDIDIEFRDSQLVIKGNRVQSDNPGQTVYHRIERRHGPFKRIITLNEPIEVDSIEATYQDGVLTILLPLRTGPNIRKIQLSTR